jgi:uncharacterized protein YaaQ
MFTVYRQPYGGARLSMGHFKNETAARTYAGGVNEQFKAEVVTIVEEADGNRSNFVDAPVQVAASADVAVPQAPIEIERLPKGSK